MKSKGQKFLVELIDDQYSFFVSDKSKISYVEKVDKGLNYTYCNTYGNALFKMKFDPSKFTVEMYSIKASAPGTPETQKRKQERVKRYISTKSKKLEYTEALVTTLQTQPKNSRLFLTSPPDNKRFLIVRFHDDGKGFDLKRSDEVVTVFTSEQFVGLGGGEVRLASGENRGTMLTIISMVLIVQKEAMSGSPLPGVGIKFSQSSPKKYKSLKHETEGRMEEMDSKQNEQTPLKESNQKTNEESSDEPAEKNTPSGSEHDKEVSPKESNSEHSDKLVESSTPNPSPPKKTSSLKKTNSDISERVSNSRERLGNQIEQLILAGLSPRSTSITPSAIPTTSSLNQEAFMDCWEKLNQIASLQ